MTTAAASLVELPILCKGCGVYKLRSLFKAEMRNQSGHSVKCKECNSTRGIELEKRNFRVRDESIKDGSKKLCRSCESYKPFVEFYKNGRYPDGCSCRCIVCDKSKCSEWKEKNPEIARATARKTQKQLYAKNPEKYRAMLRKSRLKTMYGLSEAAFSFMHEMQNGACAICIKPFLKSDRMRTAQVDHNHRTGVVRSLLCSGCNTALGIFKDDQKVMAAALKYLQRHDGKS